MNWWPAWFTSKFQDRQGCYKKKHCLKKKSKSNSHCQETPLTGKSSGLGESSLEDESEAHLPPKLCLSEDKLGLGSEQEGWTLGGKTEGFWM